MRLRVKFNYPSVFNYKKDTKMPEIKGVEKDATYEANSREVTVSDENLSNVTVNDKPQSMENNTVTFTLTAEQETMVYVITATDCAGNMSDCTVVLNQPASLPASDDTDADNAGNSGDNNTDGNASYTDRFTVPGNCRYCEKACQGG